MKMKWKIGDVQIENPFVLAPMAGVTDLPFRKLCKEQGAGLICMEMVSAKAISFHNKNTEALEADACFDEIGSALKIKQLQTEKRDLLEALEMYYKVFFLGDIPEEELKKKADGEE